MLDIYELPKPIACSYAFSGAYSYIVGALGMTSCEQMPGKRILNLYCIGRALPVLVARVYELASVLSYLERLCNDTAERVNTFTAT